MKWLVNIFISIFAFAIAYGIAFLTGISTVQYAVLIAFFIHWIAFIPAYIFQTEKFYDLTGSLTYLSVLWFTYISSQDLYGDNIGNLVLVLFISIWAIRLGSFLFMRIHKDGEDKRFRTINNR